MKKHYLLSRPKDTKAHGDGQRDVNNLMPNKKRKKKDCLLNTTKGEDGMGKGKSAPWISHTAPALCSSAARAAILSVVEQ